MALGGGKHSERGREREREREREGERESERARERFDRAQTPGYIGACDQVGF